MSFSATCIAPGRLREAAQGLAGRARREPKRTLRSALGWGSFLALVLMAAAAPHATAWARFAFRTCLWLWTASFILGGRPRPTPRFVLPLLLFFVLAGASTIHSYVPLVSWPRLASYGLVMLAVITPEIIVTKRQLKMLVAVLLVSSFVSAARTGWQYAVGIGTRVSFRQSNPGVVEAGLKSGDIIQAINHHHTRTPAQWRAALASLGGQDRIRLVVARDSVPPLRRFWTTVDRQSFERLLAYSGTQVERGRPSRAQGHFYHYIPYAGLLTELALLAWGLAAAGTKSKKLGITMLLSVLFLALMASLTATETRAYLGAAIFACLVVVWMVSDWKLRVIGSILALAAVIAGGLWLHAERGLGWVSDDAGTQFRLAMWKDGLRLIEQHPLLGVGLDSVMGSPNMWNMQAYKQFPLRGHFHSTLVEIAVDCGLPALAVWCWLWVECLVYLVRRCREPGFGWFENGMLLGVLGAVVAFLPSSVIQYNLGDNEVMELVWLSLGLAVAVDYLLRRRASELEQGADWVQGVEGKSAAASLRPAELHSN